MKTLLIAVGAVVMVLAFGTAYAADKDMGWGLSNGVTVFLSSPEPTRDAGPDMAVENGITIFDTGIRFARADEYASSSAAGGLAGEDSHIDLYNGVTVFHP